MSNNSEQFKERIISFATRDPQFKAKLQSDPIGALKDIGMTVPDGLSVVVEQDSFNRVVLVLPPEANAEALRDEELERVAGGATPSRSTEYFTC